MKFAIDPVEIHTHKPCGHRCRCGSEKAGCQKCARTRQIAAEQAAVVLIEGYLELRFK